MPHSTRERPDLTCDALVVGGGPAGSAAAALLARAGHSVLLLERGRGAPSRVCGEVQSPAARAVLARLGVLARLEALPGGRTRGVRVTGPGLEGPGLLVDYPGGSTGICLERGRLDAMLRDGARRAGARLLEGWSVMDLLVDGARSRPRVTGVRARRPDGGTARLGARIVLGCDGRNSVVARRLGLRRRPRCVPRRFGLCARLEGVQGVEDRSELHVLEGGWCSMVRISGTRVTLAAGLPSRRIEEVRDLEPMDALRRILADRPELLGRLEGARAPDGLAVLGPIAVGARRLVAHGAMLAGDAAGFLDPLTGEGIHRALLAGELAAEEAAAALGEGEVSVERLRLYEDRHRNLLGPKDRLLSLLVLATAHLLPASWAGRFLSRHPDFARELILAACGLRSPAGLLAHAFPAAWLAHGPRRFQPLRSRNPRREG